MAGVYLRTQETVSALAREAKTVRGIAISAHVYYLAKSQPESLMPQLMVHDLSGGCEVPYSPARTSTPHHVHITASALHAAFPIEKIQLLLQ